jgi:glycosyltransferase involved in cell wall biosynthesis
LSLRAQPVKGTILRVKILIDCAVPALLAPGGTQVQVEQTKAGLECLGVEVEYLRWWDRAQGGDLIHYFGTPSNSLLDLARGAGLPLLMTNLFTETCNRSDFRLAVQGALIQTGLKIPFGRQVKHQLNWGTYRRADHNIVGLACERQVLETVYRVPAERISVVPLGLPEIFLQAGPGARREPHLICTGTITERKFFVELAQLARAAEVPVLFVGKPNRSDDPYWRKFQSLLDDRFVRHEPFVDRPEKMVSLLQAARGFVLMSRFENWCLSAHEAVACGLPVLVPDQKWSRERFGAAARYFPTLGVNPGNVAALKRFYAEAARLPAPALQLHSWRAVAEQLRQVYAQVMAR